MIKLDIISEKKVSLLFIEMNESSVTRDDAIMMRSTSPASLNSLQIALFSMKDRCTKQQKKLDEQEHEISALNSSRNELYLEMKKLHEANVRLREKNVILSHELHLKSKELSEVKQKWDRDRVINESNVKQLEKLQENYLKKSGDDITISDDTTESDEMLSSLKSEDVEVTNISDVTDNTVSDVVDETRALFDNSKQSMMSMKTVLIEQQSQLVAAIDTLKQRRTVTDQSAERLISSLLNSAVTRAGDAHDHDSFARLCPMCEVVFPGESSQEEFESHVVEHFSYEESDTLRNYDTVPDAYWPGIEHNPEL